MRRRREVEAGADWRAVELPGRGTTWAVDRRGPRPDAPTVVLLHGLAATGSLNWDPIIEPLTTQFRVIALDHRGHGRGIRPDERFTLEDCADDVVALLDTLGVRRAVLVGYSMGGAISQLVWHRYGHRVAGLVLLATAARFDIPSESEPITRLLAEIGRHTDRIPIAGHSATALSHAVEALDDFDARPWLGACDLPAVVLLTTSDRVVPVQRQRELVDLLPRAAADELSGGHMLPLTSRRRTAQAVQLACHEVAVEAGLFLRWWQSQPWRARRLRRRFAASRRRRAMARAQGRAGR